MTTKYFTCAETAKIIRTALKEAFPKVKFSVKSHTYSGGASIYIRWKDGPNSAQVEAVASKFEASYFDGGIDYKGSIFHMMDGQQVRFGADFIFFNRDYSDAAIQRAIDRMMRKYVGNFRDNVGDPITVENYRKNYYATTPIPGMSSPLGHNVQGAITQILHKHSDRLKVEESPTAKRVFITHDDNYSSTNGSGFSVMPANL